MNRSLKLIGLAGLLAGLAACGGGGGGGDDGGGGGGGGGGGSAYSYVSTPVAVTSTNQGPIVAATVGGALTLGNAQPLAVSSRPAALAAARGSVQLAPPALLRSALRRTLSVALGLPPPVPAAAARPGPLAMSTTSEPCTAGGSIATTIDDRDDSNGLSAGDSIVIAFAQCNEGGGELLNGTVTLAIESLTAISATSASITGVVGFDAVSSSLGSTSAVINGTAAVNVQFSDESSQFAVTVGNSGLTQALRTAATTDDIAFAPGMRIAFVESFDAFVSTMSINGALSARSIGGSVTVATVQQFSQSDFDAYPSSGQAVITGASGSRTRLTALDSTQVRLELDGDGNGTYEASQTVSWSSLVPLN